MAPISIKSVLISESVDPRCKALLEQHGIRVTEKQSMKKDELLAEIKVSLDPRDVALASSLHKVHGKQSPAVAPYRFKSL